MLNTTNPALDLTPTGHVPHLVDQARQRVEQPETDGAREHRNDQNAETEREATRRRILDGWKEINDLARTRGTYTPALENFDNEMALLISVSEDPAGTFDRLLNLISRENAKNKTITEPRTWTYTRRSDRATVSVTCPSWCEGGHENDMDPDGMYASEDIGHALFGKEAYAEYTSGYEDYESWQILGARLDVRPDYDLPAYRVPHVQVEVSADTYTRPMGPDALAEFIGTVEGQLAELRKMHTRLVQVRAETA